MSQPVRADLGTLYRLQSHVNWDHHLDHNEPNILMIFLPFFQSAKLSLHPQHHLVK